MTRTLLSVALGVCLIPVAVSAQDPCAQAGVAQKAAEARGLARQKKFVEAEAPARAALSTCPTHAEGVAALGESLVGQKRYDDAIASMNASLQTKADLAYAYLWRGYAYYSKKQTDKMVVDFETFLRLAPAAPEAAAVKQLLGGIRR